MSKLKNVGLLAATALALPVMGSASTVTIEKTYSSIFGAPALYSNVKIDGDNISQLHVAAGGFHVSTSSSESFVAWCIDLAEGLKLPFDYQEGGPQFGADATDNLSRLFTGFVEDIDTGVKAAAFQVAIWEIISDATHDLTQGEFFVMNNQAVQDEANAYLSGLSAFDADYDLRYFTASGSQDLLTGAPSPVPLPATGLMLLAGLGMLGYRARKSA